MVREALSAPGCPLAWNAAMPAILDPTILLMLIVGARRISSSETVEMAPVRLDLFWVPYPTTTVSSRKATSSLMVTSIRALSPTLMFCVSIPRYENRRMSVLPARRDQRPSTSVTVPVFVPFINTETPGNGLPSASFT